MPLLTNIRSLTTPPPPASGKEAADLQQIDDAALVWSGDTIEWVGPAAECPAEYEDEPTHDAGGALVVPGLVDCHTHLAFGGWRADEFAMRLEGASYLEIADAGGGILSTVRETRAATEDDLFERAGSFLRSMAELGVTTVEAKSGYGLTVADELKTLRVYRRLDEAHPPEIVSTLLGAHAVPPEYEDDREGYLSLLHDELIPAVAADDLAEFCDAFVEEGAFTPDEARRLFATAREHGLQPKLHADQLSDTSGAALAADVGAASADHLEHVSADGIEALAASNVVAVSLPLASLYLDEEPLPAAALHEAGVPVAVATDFNPGTAPSYHLPLAMTLACTLQRMTPAQVLAGATRIAAAAINCDDTIGSLASGMRADFALVDAPSLNHWLYHVRPNAVRATYIGGTRWPA